jgi:hypothetical protein
MHLNDWKKQGTIAIWKYKPVNRNFPGWHMSCDSLGYDSLLSLLDLLSKQLPAGKRTLKLDKPDIWSASSSLKKTAEAKAMISLSVDDDKWCLSNENGKFLVSVGVNKLNGLVDAIKLAKSGEYDFSFGGTKGQNLWFW